MVPKFDSFDAFWPYYLKAHSKASTRAMHFIGTALMLPNLLLGLFVHWWFFVLVPVCGYGFAWISHAFIERNKPATFSYPVWSLLADLKMFYLIITRKLDDQLARYR